MKLLIGNKAYSSWSFRPWILMRHLGLPFEEEVVALYQPDTAERVRRFSKAGKLPVLVDGDIVVWESLAIIDYLADRFPDRPVWPAERAARAHARSASTEMHAGFQALRNRCGMNMRRMPKAIALADDVKADIARIVTLWTEARERFGAGGPFLYGAFSAADAMYAPVVNRFHAYAIDVPPVVAAYMTAMMALPAWQDWQRGADAEPWFHQPYEVVE
ncbi:glutathione S-transferase family protein [Phreatobacter aquaticus]|uniref:Glutathione S-transferase family protein n=1 Tax=Phreatobacter aquaticus TaxID=2570229 RepID=A0A4D7QJ92_9HYPH|nr:glutathione S-transferase family protein [Phreatobacter aquaticus]QCK87730.1 glutathione S-transferase family protein [Phreatobacter aquaticus]